MAQRDLVVRFIGDERDLKRAFTASEKSAATFQGRIQGATAGVTKNFIAAGIAAGATAVTFQTVSRAIGASVTAAVDLNEQISRTEVVLGEAADETLAWSTTTADAFGISQRAALSAASTFAGLFQTVGVAQDEAAALSRSLVQLAADLASLQNTDPSDALLALRSGLAGEAEPLRRFNIFLSEARVQTQALADTGKTNAASLTLQEKTLARYNIILRDSVLAQGNFRDTSDELANQTRILRARMDDLGASLGQILVPGLTDAANAAIFLLDALNALPDALNAIEDAVPGAQASLLDLAGVDVEFDFGTSGIDVIRGVFGDSGPSDAEESIPGDISRRRDLAKKAQDEAKKAAQAALEADREVRRASKAYQSFLKGLGLKLDRAGLSDTLADDLAVLREMERAILRRIEQEGRTFALVQSLTDVRLQINSTLQRQSDEARQAGEEAFASMLDALDLRLETARATPSLADDQAALRAIEQRLLRRIETEGETTELMRRLFNVREEQRDVARQLAEQQRARRQAAQFEALGLTAEGEERVPGGGALRRRANALEEQIKGTALDTRKNRQILDRIQNVLKGDFRKVGREVRSAILEMLNEIASALEDGPTLEGPLTKTSGLNTKKLLEGLGLSDEQINELRGRLSSVNTAGRQLAALQGTSPGTRTTSPFPADSGITIDNYVTVEIDGQKITSTVTKQQQRQRRRNPKQKRGPNRITGGA